MQFLKSRRRKKRKNILRARADNEPDLFRVHAPSPDGLLGVALFGPGALVLGPNPLTAAQLLHQRISISFRGRPTLECNCNNFQPGLIKRCVFVAIARIFFFWVKGCKMR